MFSYQCCRFHSLLKTLGSTKDSKTSDDAQICILRSMFEIYKCHQQVSIVVFYNVFIPVKCIAFSIFCGYFVRSSWCLNMWPSLAYGVAVLSVHSSWLLCYTDIRMWSILLIFTVMTVRSLLLFVWTTDAGYSGRQTGEDSDCRMSGCRQVGVLCRNGVWTYKVLLRYVSSSDAALLLFFADCSFSLYIC